MESVNVVHSTQPCSATPPTLHGVEGVWKRQRIKKKGGGMGGGTASDTLYSWFTHQGALYTRGLCIFFQVTFFFFFYIWLKGKVQQQRAGKLLSHRHSISATPLNESTRLSLTFVCVCVCVFVLFCFNFLKSDTRASTPYSLYKEISPTTLPQPLCCNECAE